MKINKIICLGFTGNEFEDNYWSELDSLTEKRILATETDIKDHPDADALLVRLGAKVDKELIDSLPNLKYIGMLGTGYGGIDVKYASQKSITITNIADYATEGVAEFTFAILLEYLRSIATAKLQARESNYSDDFTGTEIKGKVFGVIGLGHIGLRTAELAKAFGADVLYWSQNRKEAVEGKEIKYSDIVIAEADILTVNLSLNPQTEGYFNADRIASIKSGAIVINPSPMELFDFDALVARLKKGDITYKIPRAKSPRYYL